MRLGHAGNRVEDVAEEVEDADEDEQSAEQQRDLRRKRRPVTAAAAPEIARPEITHGDHPETRSLDGDAAGGLSVRYRAVWPCNRPMGVLSWSALASGANRKRPPDGVTTSNVVTPMIQGGQTPVAPAVGAATRGSRASRQGSLSARTCVRMTVFATPFLQRSGFDSYHAAGNSDHSAVGDDASAGGALRTRPHRHLIAETRNRLPL